MFSGALARAAGIKIALAIGKGAVAEAKYTAAVGDVWCLPALSWILQIGVSVVTGVLVLISLLVFLRPSDLAGIFASDPEFIQVFLTSMIQSTRFCSLTLTLLTPTESGRSQATAGFPGLHHEPHGRSGGDLS